MAESFFEIYKTTGNKKYLKQAKSCLNFTFENFNKGLIHSIQKIGKEWVKIKSPKIIGATAYSIKVYYEVFGKLRKKEYDFVFKNQTKTGFFKNTEGYGIRDYIGSLPWNAFNFELLSLVSEEIPKLVKFENHHFFEGKYEIIETKDSLKLNLEGKNVFFVDKSTGRNIKKVIPKKLIKSIVSEKYSHMLMVKDKRAINFGFVDNKGNIFYDNNMNLEKIVFWIPNKQVKNYLNNNNFFEINVKNRPERKIYYLLRKTLFNTPLFDLFARTKR